MQCLRATMYWPSGDQAGLLSRRNDSLVTAWGFEPSRFMIQMLSPPPWSLVKAMVLPSGL